MAYDMKKCAWCGKWITWISIGDRRIALDAEPTPYKRRTDAAAAPVLYTRSGGVIKCLPMPKGRGDGADGEAYQPHVCSKKPVYHRPRPMTRREKFKSYYD